MTLKIKPQINWHLIDATDKPLGRLSTKISLLLRGKNKVTFQPNIDIGDHVVVINAKKIKFTGDKMNQKKYFSHSGYIGNLKTKNIQDIGFDLALKHSIAGMLPNNKLKNNWLKKLHIYLDDQHPHQANLAANKQPNGE